MHFPMSKGVGSMMSENGLVPTVPFLRLAAQETRFELMIYRDERRG